MVAIKAVSTEGKELEIIRKLFADYQKELDEDLCFQRFGAELKEPLKKYGPPRGIIYLAFYNGEPAGCIALMPLADENGRKVCEMKRLYVIPAFRQFRIGRQLVDTLLDKARQLGYGLMKLDTLGKLGPAIALYGKCGFRETTSYYDNPLPGVVYMEKEL
jgi:putative acetyltransferase